jgi:hypothetical protein
MENLKTDSKKIVSILGLPRQGTTLIAGIFNSPGNSFSAIEPHWSKICGKEIMSGNKIPMHILGGNPTDQVIGRLKEYLEKADFLDVCSIKETYRHNEKECCNFLLESNYVDVHLFIFRDPVFGFNGWKKARWSEWYNKVENYKESYRQLYQDSINLEMQGKNVCRISYEDICKPSVSEYLNNKLSKFGIQFPLGINGTHPIETIFGDPRASMGGPISRSSDSSEFLNESEISSLIEIRESIYKLV